MAIDVGSRIRDYEIVARLRAGGMATLFLARRAGAAGFSRHVAIKVVHPHLAADQEFVRMFVDEALLSARIHHPNVVHVEELGEEQGTYFLAMEYVHGSALSTLLGALARLERRLSPELAVYVACAVLDGLHAAHELRSETGQPLNVVHRDVSPQNVLVSTSGHVKLIDFGIAKAAGQGKRTETGSLKGKIRYMSPEQAYGRPVDRRTDTYALAIVLWEMLTMHRMFGAGNDLAVLDMVRNPSPEPPSHFAERIPPALDAAVLRGLAPDPAARPATALELRRLLLEALPSAASVDGSQLAEVMDAVLGERMEARQRALPESLTGMGGPRGPDVSRSFARGDVLQHMTISAPGAKYATEDISPADPGPFAERSGPGAGSFAPAPAPAIGTPAPERARMSGERMFAIAAGGVALLAVGIAGGVVLGGGAGVGAPAVAAPPVAATALPPPASPVSVPAAPLVAADAGLSGTAAEGAPAAAPPVATPEPPSGPARPRPRRERAPRDRTVVGGVPIYDDDDF